MTQDQDEPVTLEDVLYELRRDVDRLKVEIERLERAQKDDAAAIGRALNGAAGQAKRRRQK